MYEMEKQMKAIGKLHRRKLTNLKIVWDSEKRKLSFTKHLINGAPVPKDIVLPAVYNRGVEVSWSCDEEV